MTTRQAKGVKPGVRIILAVVASLALVLSGVILLLEEAGLRSARATLQQVNLDSDHLNPDEIRASLESINDASSARTDVLEMRLALEEKLTAIRTSVQDPSEKPDLNLLATARDTLLELARQMPMPGRNWCLLAAVEARLHQLSPLAVHALEICGRSIPGDRRSLDARWELSLLAWPVLPQTVREHFQRDLRFLTQIERFEGQSHVERLASIAARTAPGRAPVISTSLISNPELNKFFLSALEQAVAKRRGDERSNP